MRPVLAAASARSADSDEIDHFGLGVGHRVLLAAQPNHSPELTSSDCPVTADDMPLAKKSTAAATSSGVAMCWSALCDANRRYTSSSLWPSRAASSLKKMRRCGPSMKPGTTQLTRILSTTELGRERLRRGEQRRLGRAVTRKARLGLARRQRADHDDRSAAALLHGWDDGLRKQQRAEDVDLEGRAPSLGEIDGVDGAGAPGGERIVDEHVDPAERCDRAAATSSLAILGAGDVTRRPEERARRRPRPLWRSPAPRVRCGKRERDRPPRARRRARSRVRVPAPTPETIQARPCKRRVTGPRVSRRGSSAAGCSRARTQRQHMVPSVCAAVSIQLATPGSRWATTTRTEPSGRSLAECRLIEDRVIAIIERFHPVVIELEVPVVTSGRRHLDDERFVRLKAPVAVVIGDVRGAAGRRRHLGVEKGQLVHARLKPVRPLIEKASAPFDELGGGGETAIDRLRRQRAGRVPASHPFDLELGRRLARPIEERLPHDERAALGRHGQPVAGPRLASSPRSRNCRQASIESSRSVEVAARVEAPGGAVIALLRAEPEVMNGAALAEKTIFVFPADGGILIIVIGIVGPHLDRLVASAQKLRRRGIGVFDECLERRAQQPREVAVTLGALERVARREIAGDDVAGRLERIAEFVPGRAVHDAAGSIVGLPGIHASGRKTNSIFDSGATVLGRGAGVRELPG